MIYTRDEERVDDDEYIDQSEVVGDEEHIDRFNQYRDGKFFLHLMFTRNDNEDEKVELTLPLAEEICSRHMWCVLNNDDIEDDRKGPLNHHALSCHVMAMIYHQALLMWPIGIASEEDIHGATDNDNDDD